MTTFTLKVIHFLSCSVKNITVLLLTYCKTLRLGCRGSASLVSSCDNMFLVWNAVSNTYSSQPKGENYENDYSITVRFGYLCSIRSRRWMRNARWTRSLNVLRNRPILGRRSKAVCRHKRISLSMPNWWGPTFVGAFLLCGYFQALPSRDSICVRADIHIPPTRHSSLHGGMHEL